MDIPEIPGNYFFTILDFVLSEVFSINPSVDVFAFADFNVHCKDWLTYSAGTDRPGELVIIFLPKTASLRWLTLLLGSLTITLIVVLFWSYFFLLTLFV